MGLSIWRDFRRSCSDGRRRRRAAHIDRWEGNKYYNMGVNTVAVPGGVDPVQHIVTVTAFLPSRLFLVGIAVDS